MLKTSLKKLVFEYERSDIREREGREGSEGRGGEGGEGE